MGFGIPAVFMLADPEVEGILRHERLDTPITGRAPVIQRQVAVHNVRNEIRAPHREPPKRIRLDGDLRVVEAARSLETIPALLTAIKYGIHIVYKIHQARRRLSTHQERRTGTGLG